MVVGYPMTGIKGRSGRKPQSTENRVARSIRIDRRTDEVIRARRREDESYAATIDRIVREWDASQP